MKAFFKYHIKDRLVLFKKAIQLRFWKSKAPILVHTMGKVGSLSVYSSLKRSLSKTSIFHTHSLSLEGAKQDVALCFENGIYPGSRSSVFLIDEHIISKQKPYKIISLFRDPIDRNISAFFDAFQMYVGCAPEFYKGDLKTLAQLFFKHIPHQYPIDWYDDCMLKDTGINVFDYDFNAELGYQVIQQDQKKLLLMNCYLDDIKKEKLIKEFCGLSNFKLDNTNVTDSTKYADLYASFKEFIQFSEDYIKELYTSKYALHFFTKKEREQAIKKWSKK